MSRSIIASILSVIIMAVTFASCERHSPILETAQPAPAASVSAPVPPPPVVTTPDEPETCPSDMVMVEGDYCEGVAHQCLESKPGNGCVRFKPGVAKCLGKVEHMKFCIDKFEWPNKEGSKPLLMQSWDQGVAQCTAIGKRLCDDDEWTQACEGPDHQPYPYGWARDKKACNIDNKWIKWSDNDLDSNDPTKVAAEVRRLDHTVPSGAYAKCVSPYGVHDMTGNADEWAVNVTGGGKPYISYLKGGHWVGGVRNRCRPATESHSRNDQFYDFGFRCCSAPK